MSNQFNPKEHPRDKNNQKFVDKQKLAGKGFATRKPIKPMNKNMEKLFKSASKLQELVPGAVMVGGSAVNYYTNYRLSHDADHIVNELNERFDDVLSVINEHGFKIARTVKGKIILGSFDDTETGTRQLIREKPLEVENVDIFERNLKIPTISELARIKSYLIIKRNYDRDYYDVVALADKFGDKHIVDALSKMDDYYKSDNENLNPITTELVLKLSNPKWKQPQNESQKMKGLISPYKDKEYIIKRCKQLSKEIIQK